ncbi:unnamed protein product [Arabidopsis halleri]
MNTQDFHDLECWRDSLHLARYPFKPRFLKLTNRFIRSRTLSQIFVLIYKEIIG